MKHDPLIPVPADMVHHIKERSEYPELALTLDNLISLCNACHNKNILKRVEGKRKTKKDSVCKSKSEQRIHIAPSFYCSDPFPSRPDAPPSCAAQVVFLKGRQT